VAYNGYTASAKTAAAKSNFKSFQKLLVVVAIIGILPGSSSRSSCRCRFITVIHDSKNNQALEIDVVE
jgi:hypothetical protein